MTRSGKRVFFPREELGAAANEMGGKAHGLAPMPRAWVPEFFVVNPGVRKSPRDDLSNAVNRLLHSEPESRPGRTRLPRTPKLIVRSSATGEDLSHRGRFESAVVSRSLEDVQKGLELVKAAYKARGGQSGRLRLVVQLYYGAPLFGHLSNERRVAENENEWALEYFGDQEVKPIQFTAQPLKKPLRGPLWCQDHHELDKRLREVARSSSSVKGRRVHYEWAWDGDRLWIVQADEETPRVGTHPPGSRVRGRRVTVDESHLRILRPWQKSVGAWRKVKALRIFEACDLPVPRLYVLEDERVIQALRDGGAPADVIHDLDSLMGWPIVIRTEAITGESDPGFNSPRTDCISTREAAIEFLQNASRKLEGQMAFFIHQFIEARAGAWATIRPAMRSVRIDGTWGVPDGLQFLSHDTFFVPLSKKNKERQRIRCKPSFLDVDETGKWVETAAGEDIDWQPSLSPAERKTIAQATVKVSKHLESAVSVMFFVGVAPESGLPALIPWYETTDTIVDPEGNLDVHESPGRQFLVRDDADLDFLEKVLKQTQEVKSLAMRPNANLFRDDEFLVRAATIARAANLHVELEGSQLSHAYYMLKRNNVRVRCADPFEPRPSRVAFNKLVRDKIPERIQGEGLVAETAKPPPKDLAKMLRVKLVEEALELRAAHGREGALEEAADVYEILQTIAQGLGLTMGDVVRHAEKKRGERGGFERGLFLLGSAASSGENSQKRLIDELPSRAPSPDVLRPQARIHAKRRISDGAIIIGIKLPLVPSMDAEFSSAQTSDKNLSGKIRYLPKEAELELVLTPPKARDSHRIEKWAKREAKPDAEERGAADSTLPV